jgi:hypothetical protein
VLLRIRWLRVLGAALLVELVLFSIAMSLNRSASGRAVLLAIVIPICVVATFIGGWWAARNVSGLLLIHGFLVGALSALIYAGITWKVSLPTTYIVANYLKVVGGTAGGLTAQLQVRSSPA